MRLIGIALIFALCLGGYFGEMALQQDVRADEARIYPRITMKYREQTTTTRIPFTAFKSLEQIDEDATLNEVSRYAAERFGNHPSSEEWVERCFNLRQKGEGSFLELKRFAELHIQIMSEVDASKYAQEINAYRVALGDLDKFAQAGGDDMYGLPFGMDVAADSLVVQNQIIVTYDWDPAMRERLRKLPSLIEKNSRGARAKIRTVAEIRFENHRLADEWCALYLRLSRDGKGTFSDMKRLSELEVRMLADVNPTKYAEPIRKHQHLMQRYDQSAKKLTGKNPAIFQVNFRVKL